MMSRIAELVNPPANGSPAQRTPVLFRSARAEPLWAYNFGTAPAKFLMRERRQVSAPAALALARPGRRTAEGN
jgi:hypothetical protein